MERCIKTGKLRNPWKVPLSDDDPWPEHPMSVLRTQHDTSRTSDGDGLPPTFLNVVTHWWDGSQIYASDADTQAKVRSHKDGKLTIGSDGLLPPDPDSGVEITGVNHFSRSGRKIRCDGKVYGALRQFGLGHVSAAR